MMKEFITPPGGFFTKSDIVMENGICGSGGQERIFSSDPGLIYPVGALLRQEIES